MKSKKRKKTAKQVLPFYEHPIFVPIEDRDEASIKYYKNSGVPVARFALPCCPMRYYAILEGRTQAEADVLNRQLGNWVKQEVRDNARRSEREVSYDAMAEDGYDAAQEDANPEDIVLRITVERALYEEVSKLKGVEIRICRMAANKEPECAVAEEIGMKRTTMRDRKKAIFAGLADRLDKYR